MLLERSLVLHSESNAVLARHLDCELPEELAVQLLIRLVVTLRQQLAEMVAVAAAHGAIDGEDSLLQLFIMRMLQLQFEEQTCDGLD